MLPTIMSNNKGTNFETSFYHYDSVFGHVFLLEMAWSPPKVQINMYSLDGRMIL